MCGYTWRYRIPALVAAAQARSEAMKGRELPPALAGNRGFVAVERPFMAERARGQVLVWVSPSG